MFEGWQDFYLMAGGAAAVLIGLIFVVISLMQNRSRSSVLAGSRLYMGPIVLGVSFVMALSAMALTPGIGRNRVALIVAVVALWGLARGLMSAVGLRRRGFGEEIHWTDFWFYGIFPSLLYLAFGATALAFWEGWSWAHDGLAASVVGGLLLGIRNEWDLITWIAPQRDTDGGGQFG